jgi:hypothetical protein
MRCLNIKDYCWNTQSVTKDPYVSMRFNELRTSSGEQFHGQSPNGYIKTICQLQYGSKRRIYDEMSQGPVLKAKVMEDKWDIFLYDKWLYFAHSWNGQLYYRANVEISSGMTIVHEIEVEAGLATEGMDLALCDVDFLIKSHLHNLPVPNRIPGNIPETDKQLITMYSYNSFGRWASYATYEDTLQLQI